MIEGNGGLWKSKEGNNPQNKNDDNDQGKNSTRDGTKSQTKLYIDKKGDPLSLDFKKDLGKNEVTSQAIKRLINSK